MVEEYESEHPPQDNNFIKQNKLSQKMYPVIKESMIRTSSQVAREKLQRVYLSKETQLSQSRKLYYFNLHRWDIIKMKKQEMIGEQMHKREERKRK